MNTLIINYEYPPLGGGGGVATQHIAEELARRHTVHVITSAFGDLPRTERDGNLTIHRVRVAGRKTLPTASVFSMLTFVPAAYMRGVTLCRNISFDVLNAQFVLPSGLPAALLARIFRIPFVLSFIGGDLYDPSKGISPHRHWYLRAVVRWVASHAVLCTAISTDTRRRAQSIHGVTQPIEVVPLGFIPPHIEKASRADLGIPDDVPVAITIGRLIPRKGYDVLVHAWKLIPNVHLLIIGDGPWKEKIAAMIAREGLSDRVTLRGFVEEKEKQQLLAVCDMYVSATQHEGFGIVFLEAMYAGLPIVAPNEGGQTDFLTNQKNALLVSPDNPEEIANAVKQLVDNPQLRAAIGARNRDDVTAYYLNQTVGRFERVLQQAASL